jgi:hypothetical protein|nr:MAG TPA: Coenzyme PQQ synthesis protein D [Caudoviricetes sp.]
MPTNMMQIISLMKNGGNPQQMVLSMLEQQTENNPFAANLLQLAKGNKSGEIEQIARNLAKEKGIDFDTEFNNFKKTLGL